MPKYEPFDWYETPLYYDIVFDEETEREGAFLEGALKAYGSTGGRSVLEPACGTGRLVAEMARRGFRVAGFDASGPALRFARRRLREARLGPARLGVGRLERFDLGRSFDLAHCLVSSFKYLTDEAGARSHLRCVADALRPGGLYVLGLHLTEYEHRGRLRERWAVGRDGLEVVCNIQTWPADRRRRLQRLRSRLLVREAGAERRYETHWTFRTYSARQLRRLLRSEDRLEHVATHDFDCDLDRTIDLDGDQLDVVLVLRKK